MVKNTVRMDTATDQSADDGRKAERQHLRAAPDNSSKTGRWSGSEDCACFGQHIVSRSVRACTATDITT